MAKLNQIVAAVSGKKTRTEKMLTEAYKKLQKQDLFSGLTRTYEVTQEGEEQLPPEKTLVKYTVHTAIEDATKALSEIIDVVATQDQANTQAFADIVLDEKVLVNDVPVTYLMFLEKKLIDIRTFVDTLPTLDEAYSWKKDENTGHYISEPTKTNRTKKKIYHKVVVEPTDKHPAIVVEVSEDIKVGEFTAIKFSGAIPIMQKKAMLERVEKLIDAVKYARESANQFEVTPIKVADKLLNYVFE